MSEAGSGRQPFAERAGFESARGELSVDAENIGLEGFRGGNHHGTVIRCGYFLVEKIRAACQKYYEDEYIFHSLFHD